MQTYVSPIGYDSRRVTMPVINRGLSDEDELVLLRPGEESDTERASQTITDVEQFLQQVEPECTVTVERVVTESFKETVRSCCRILGSVDGDRDLVVSLGGGARDVLLPLTIATFVYAPRVETTLFFSDLDNSVQEWEFPNLLARIPDRTLDTFDAIVETGEWVTLTTIAESTGQSKSTVIRHVQDLEDAGIVESDTSEKAKRVRVAFTGELLSIAAQVTE